MLNVGIIGLGLTGSAIAKYLIEHRPDMRIVLAGAGPSSSKAGADLGALLGMSRYGVAVMPAEALPAALQAIRPEAVIDFSKPESTIGLLRHYARAGCGVVVGTTGFTPSQQQQLQHAAGTRKFGLMYAPNITRGVNVLMMIARLAAAYLPGHDIEIIERHHRRKTDAPSGTAAKIAGQLHAARHTGVTHHGREGMTPRQEGEIGMHAVRGGGIVGVHEVLFAGEFDEITITHRSESRLAFAAGAADAAAWVATRRGYYTVEDMIASADTQELFEEMPGAALDAVEAVPAGIRR
ncbi:MAG TPA: 4-hydroxy-tetrahydrodipicolinate reductase [Armatimonadota bacterium]|nr:4-hydroxy-tetrahydrodipicolinate reductase [Armatimonadota bacterium]HOS44225.1 4-hydroxy-tetrahydrodipicolinate reductase [Armatimonadota bacterium]